MKTMKCISLFFLAILCCIAHADEDSDHVQVHSRPSGNCNQAQMSDPQQAEFEKRYIDPNNVSFEQSEMYVQSDQGWVVTNALYTDANGFYILETKGGWTCSYCGYYNEGNIWTCEGCGRRRD
jgi:hypothetical protein